jgi:uroporphyrinogen-III decarboxylase
MMTRKERFLSAVRGKQPDRVPMFDFLFQQPLYEALIGRRPGAYNARDAVACALALDHDAVWLPFGGFNGFQPKFLDANTYVDEWGTTYRHNESSWPIDAPIDYLPDLAETKIAAIHPLQRTAGMDLRWVKQHYGIRFCIIGNIDSSRTLPFGTPGDVAAEVREAIEIAAPGGGYVLASDHSLHDGIPVENVRTMFAVGREYGGSSYRQS